MRCGAAEVVIGAPAIAATALHSLSPSLTADLLGLVDDLLPGRPTAGNQTRHGSQQATPTMRSPLVALGQAAVRRLNQRYAVVQRDGPAIADELAAIRH